MNTDPRWRTDGDRDLYYPSNPGKPSPHSPHSPHPTDSPWTGRFSSTIREICCLLAPPPKVCVNCATKINRSTCGGCPGFLAHHCTSHRPGPFCHRPPTPPRPGRFIKAWCLPLLLLHAVPSLLFHEFSTLPLAQSPSRPPSNHISPAEAHKATQLVCSHTLSMPLSHDCPRETRRRPTRPPRPPGRTLLPQDTPVDLDDLPEPGRGPRNPPLLARPILRLGSRYRSSKRISGGAQEP
jgi:hypothetical protein